MSQDITSTLKIADGFTEPLTNLAKQLATADNLATALAKTLKDQMEIFSKSTDEIIEHVAAYADYLIPNLDIVDVNLKKIDKSFGKIAKASRKAFEKSDSSITKIKESAINSSKYIGRSFVQTFRPFTDSLKSIGLNAKISASVIREEFGSLKNVVGVNFKMATVDGKVIWSQFINDMRLSMPMAMKSSFNNVYSTIKSGTRLSASQVKDGMIRAFEGFKGPTGFGAKLQLAIKNPINTINGEIPKLEKNFSKVSKTIEKQGKKIGKELRNIKQALISDVFGNIIAIGTEKMAMGAFNKLKDSYIRVFSSLQRSIEISIDDIAISEKLEAMYGEAGKYAKDRAFELANEIGESTAMVADLSAQAAYQGIGQDSFERIVGLADKISSMKPGETFENVASSLISNIKSGHDAASIAQLYGGGQVMERQLRNAGFERALNRGDIQGALDIAEKIAEKAGLTKERYEDAYSNMSQNYQKIINIVDNVKKKFAETFNRSFAPTIKKIKDMLESDTFKKIIKYLNKAVEMVGKIANFITEKMVDNVKILGILFAVGMVAKAFLLFKRLKMILGTVKFIKDILFLFKGPFGFILTGLRKMIAHLISIGIKQTLILIKTKAIAAIKMVGPWLLVGAAIAGALYVLHRFLGVSETFKGFLAGLWQSAINGFTNIFIFFDRLVDHVKILKLRIQYFLVDVTKSIKQKLAPVFRWLVEQINDFIEKSGLGAVLDFLGVDLSGMNQAVEDWISGIGEEETAELEAIQKQIDNITNAMVDYIDTSRGIKEAIESEGKSIIDNIKGNLFSNKKQEEEQKKIKDDSDKIRRQGEQEEELRWLKAFSDRQITSSYNSMTSNVRNLTINGMSQAGMAEVGRRNLSTMPTRSAS